MNKQACRRCASMIWVGAFHTCSNKDCYYHIPLASEDQPLVLLTVKTRKPTKYTLHDHETGDVWRGTATGMWIKERTK